MMKKIYLFLLIFGATSLGMNAQLFEFSSRDAAKLTNRKLIVVLQDEVSEVLHRIKKDEAKIKRYKALIAYTNDLLRKTVPNFWNGDQPIEFRTFQECKKLMDSSTAYITLDFTSLRLNENTQLYLLKPDTNDLYRVRSELMQRKEYGCFELKLIEKFNATAFYTFSTPSSIPNEYDFIVAIQFMSALIREKLNDPKFSTRDYELKIQKINGTLARRTLMADSNIVNKQSKSYAYIAKEYDTLCLYQLSDPKGMAAKAYSKDTSWAYLCIVPYLDPIARGQSYLGTSGGNINDYEKKVYFMHLIFDVGTGALLYYDKTEENIVLVRDWHRLLRYSRESPFKMPSFQKSNYPSNQQQQQNYQPNQY